MAGAFGDAWMWPGPAEQAGGPGHRTPWTPGGGGGSGGAGHMGHRLAQRGAEYFGRSGATRHAVCQGRSTHRYKPTGVVPSCRT